MDGSLTINVLQHAPHEGLGLFVGPLEGAGCRVVSHPLYDGARVPGHLVPGGALIVMGGPMNVDEVDAYPYLAQERELLAHAVAEDYPVLGICLGAQLVARAAGARVFRGPQKEIGFYPVQLTDVAADDPLFCGLPASLRVFQWHGDTFDLPAGAVRLAQSDVYPNQAFRLGERVYGLQFHLETTATMVSDWLHTGAAEVIAEPSVDAAAVEAAAPVAERMLRPLAAGCLQAWLALARGGRHG